MENRAELDNEIEIDLKELFLELLAFWKLILLALVLGAVIAYSVSKFLMVPQYESTAELYVLSKSTSITSLADIQTGTSLTNDYMVVVEGRPVLEQVIANLGLDETYKSLEDKVTLENPSNSRILMITVRDENPLTAKAIADEIAKVGSNFISLKMDQDPPTIIQNGYADGEPVSPSVFKNTALGGIVGAFLAMAIVVLSYLFNDTIMTAEDVEKKLGMNILGTVPLETDKNAKKKRNTDAGVFATVGVRNGRIRQRSEKSLTGFAEPKRAYVSAHLPRAEHGEQQTAACQQRIPGIQYRTEV